jgi:hypothetical protein
MPSKAYPRSEMPPVGVSRARATATTAVIAWGIRSILEK